jgi:hypothetical protein
MPQNSSSLPEFIDLVFAKTSTKRSFTVIENKRFGLVFAKTGSIKSGTGRFKDTVIQEMLCLPCLYEVH